MRLYHSTTLPNGLRVRLRLPIPSDRARLRELWGRLGGDADELATTRLVWFDPRERSAICATAFAGAGEAIVGYGSMERHAEQPDLLLVDDELAPGIEELLTEALSHHAARDAA